MNNVNEAGRIRVGLVGLGGMANVHYENICKVSGMEVAAVCDMDLGRVQSWGDRLGLPENKRYLSHEQLISDDELDAIVSATPNNIHYSVVEACLRHGKPLMAEKPFTLSFSEAHALKEQAETYGRDCFVGFSYRYVPSFRMAREWIRDGRIGQVRHLSVQYLQDWGVPLHGTPMNWRWDRSVTGTGVLHDLASHMVDAVRFLVGEPQTVHGVMSNLINERPAANGEGKVSVDIDDFAAFTMLLEGDIPAVCQTSRNAYGSGNQIELSIYGDLGTLHVGYEFGESLVWIHREGMTCGKTREELRVPDQYKLLQMQDFANYVLSGAEETTPVLWDGYRNQLTLEAVIRSSDNGRSITLEEIEAEYTGKVGMGT
jgi:predicted dehydrogenase